MQNEFTTPRISVVIATYNRPDLAARLLTQLAAQTMAATEFEVVVVDDGSRVAFPEISVPYRLTVLRQENQGAAAARHRGARAASGDVVLFLDDDMEVPNVLLEEHARLHDEDPSAVVLGWIKPSTAGDPPLFERFHARHLDQLAEGVRGGRLTLRGIDVWSGNLSLRRQQYLKVGGFDAELGLSDHASLSGWLKRAYRYGGTDLRISRKHPDVRHANPWRYSSVVTPLSLPFLACALAAPRSARVVARGVMAVATSLDAIGMERAALAGTDLAFGMQYARGLRDEVGGLGATVRDLVRYHRA
jgi:glycosyltransferase involved in cell wall biosynthesis